MTQKNTFDEDEALSLAERTFSTEIDEQLASDIIQYASRLHSRFQANQPSVPNIATQVEAWVTVDTVDGQIVNGKSRRIWWENSEGVGIPIYTATQSAVELVEALESLIEYVPHDVVQCRGDKCREPWCVSCFDDEDAESYIATAASHLKNAKSALAAYRKRG